MPLFLELVRQLSTRDPDLARDALAGLRAYAAAPRPDAPPPPPEIARVRGACLRDHGGAGPPAVLIPSLINPPRILDLDPDVSLAAAVARMGRRSLLLDWGLARDRADLDVAGHVEHVLVPLLRELGQPPALVGYCLGGTMALAAANLIACERVATLATPWNFATYPDRSLEAIRDTWTHARAAAADLGALPMEVLQANFWSLDPQRTVAKFAEFGHLDPASPSAARFVELEDWANGGEPLPFPAARELMEDIFGRDLPGKGEWLVGGVAVTDDLPIPRLHLLAASDRIAPPATAAAGRTIAIASGHVGMVVGSARKKLHAELAGFLDSLAAGSAGR
ncbi:alpha/beta hydrolase [Sphingomonas lutea]|uniref:Alpha/beta hydrolase n=1 Tax=Sphingomonas lutea TaxID=1045317 RepID=A0A7G9SLA3_9SPHN|nr:alpha/beta hydrolase [Sphingomonas lutea]